MNATSLVRRSSTAAILACAAALALLSSCTSTYYSHRFVPAPLEVALQVEGEPQGQARALVTVKGIRRPDKDEHLPAQVEGRIRLENLGAVAVTLVPESFELLAADLTPFGRPFVAPPAGVPIEPKAAVVYDFQFPLPEGKELKELDLRGLNLRWSVDFAGRSVTTGITFERYVAPADHGHHDPFYPRTHIGIGFVGHFSDD